MDTLVVKVVSLVVTVVSLAVMVATLAVTVVTLAIMVVTRVLKAVFLVQSYHPKDVKLESNDLHLITGKKKQDWDFRLEELERSIFVRLPAQRNVFQAETSESCIRPISVSIPTLWNCS